MPFSVPERSQERGERDTAAPQADTTAQTTAGRVAAASPRARAGTGRLRPSQAPFVRPKLRLGGENDHYEREADRLAEGLAATAGLPGGEPRPDETAPSGASQRVAPASGSPGMAVDPSLGQLILDAQGEGRSLPDGERRHHERSLGAALGGVRLHTDQRAGELNQRLGSSAFTAGRDIFFGHGKYNLTSDSGRDLLGHELVHVAQQANGEPLVRLARKAGRKTKKRIVPRKKVVPLRGPQRAKVPRKAKAEQSAGPGRGAKRANPDDAGKPGQEKKARQNPKPGAAKLSDVQVTYLSQEKMADFLKTKQGGGLTTPPWGYQPNPVRVGVVVWNINHLKEDAEDTAELEAAQATAKAPNAKVVAIKPVRDKAVKGKATKTAGKASKEEVTDDTGPEPMESEESKSHKIESIVEGLETLRGQLEPVFERLDMAAKSVTKGFGKSEASQFKTDIKMLTKLTEDERAGDESSEDEVAETGVIAETGVNSLQDVAAQESDETISVRAQQLEDIRELSTVWNRLVRLHRTLFSKSTKTTVDGVPRNNPARTKIRAALTDKEKDKIRGTLDKLFDDLPVRDVQKSVSKLKKGTVVDLSVDQYFKEKTVVIVVLNEVNRGLKSIELRVRQRPGLALSKGPVMLAKGKQLAPGTKAGTGITIGKGGNAQRVKAGQYEYYPAIYRTDEGGVKSNGTFYVATDGTFAVQDEKTGKNEGIPWDKTPDKPTVKLSREEVAQKRQRNKDLMAQGVDVKKLAKREKAAETKYRGIVVHRFEQNDQEFWVGVLHTTPGGHDLDRKDIWPQIERALAGLNKLALDFKVPLLVGGDFYIPAEGVVNDPDNKVIKEIKESNADDIGKAKAWQLARNVFLKAAENGNLDALLEHVRDKSIPAVDEDSDEEMEVDEESEQEYDEGSMEDDDESAEEGSDEAAMETEEEDEKNAYQPKKGIINRRNAKRMSELWKLYKERIARHSNDPLFGAKFNNNTTRALIAPAKGYENVTWTRSLGYGKVSELTIFRNYARILEGTDWKDAPPLTMEAALKELRYKVVDTANPTNPKHKSPGENKMQLADLFLTNEYWAETMSGLLAPDEVKLQQVDNSKLTLTKKLTQVSDHLHNVLIASTVPNDLWVHDAFKMPNSAQEQLLAVNLAAWDRMEEWLAGVKTNSIPVDKQIARIRIALYEAYSNPDEKTTGNLASQKKAAKEIHRKVREQLAQLPKQKEADKAQRTKLDRELDAYVGTGLTADLQDYKKWAAAQKKAKRVTDPKQRKEEEIDRLGRLITSLRVSIQRGNNNDLTPEEKQRLTEALDSLRHWERPYYVTDISNTEDIED